MSTISASTTTTTAYKVTADTTGTLVLQTGSTPTTAVTVDGSQRMGIGTSSPANLLHVSTSTASNTKFEQTSTGANYLTLRSNGADKAFIGLENSSGTGLFGGGTAYGLSIGTTGSAGIAFATNNTITGAFQAGGNFQINNGFGSVATIYGCRVWARVTGGGGSGGLPATSLLAGGNASSFTKNSTGDYTLSFTSAMPDTTYAVSTNQETGNVTFDSTIVSYNQYTGSVQVVSDNNRVQADFRYGSIAVFR